jgi:Protein of unknown function (DUF3775)
MPDLSLPADFLSHLIFRMRGVQAREGEIAPDPGSNAIDDDMADALEDSTDDLSREEIREEIRGLGPDEQAELVALLWVGRGDAEPAEWEATLNAARERAASPTEEYLLQQPLVADYWAEGAEQLGISLPDVL